MSLIVQRFVNVCYHQRWRTGFRMNQIGCGVTEEN